MLETSLLVLTIAILGVISPGPDFFLIIKNAVRYPRPAAMMSAIGIIAGIATHMSYCVAGLAVVIKTTPWLFAILKYAGAGYLMLIGIQAFLNKGGTSLMVGEQHIEPIRLKKAFLQGYYCNLLNPKATLFFLAIFTQVLSLQSTLAEKLWYALLIIIPSLLWWPLLILLIQSPWVVKGLGKTHKLLDKLFGGVLIALGLKVALS